MSNKKFVLKTTKTFSKELKKLFLNNLNIDDLNILFKIINNLQNGNKINSEYKNHKLKEFKHRWDCHIKNDLVLIYKLDKNKNELILERIGSHSQLFD